MDKKQTLPTNIEIKGVYKIFGSKAKELLPLVKEGMDKTTLKEEHNHVLGLKDINIDIPPGQIQVIMGLSGSGKSTLIRHINRLIDPTDGQILVNGQDITTFDTKQLRDFRRKRTAMVFQKFALLPHYTVLENVTFGLDIRGFSTKKSHEKAYYWIERVGLKNYEESYPNQLSGGMQQRVGLARALTNDAPVLLMDEAFSALDPLIRSDMQSVLLDLQQELNKTIVFITHDLEEALRLGERISILRDGRVIQQGTGQQIILKPADDYIMSFTRDVNRGRVIRCKTLMQDNTLEDAINIHSELVIEEAARQMSAENVESANLISKKGTVIGSITMSDIIAAMVPPRDKEI
jgi:glycine betaine/proline transport system ATP-binding protein